MHKDSFISSSLIIIFLLAISIPVFAKDGTIFIHSARYKLDGMMNITRSFGDPCRTGAYKEQSIRGYGQLTKNEDALIAYHIMTVEDEMEWSVAEDAVRGLRVTSSIELCARPMSVATDSYAAGYVYNEDDYEIKRGDIISPYHPLVVDGIIDVIPMTRQVWVTMLSTNPGHRGAFNNDFIAAYGPGPYEEDSEEEIHDADYRWWFIDDDLDEVDRGDYYVGNYFEIDQYTLTTSGDTRRFISISSPFYNTFLEEELSVLSGMAEIRDHFSYYNLEPGPEARTLVWHEFVTKLAWGKLY